MSTTVTTDNPLLAAEGLPDFGRMEPSQILPAIEHTIRHARERLEAFEGQFAPTWDRTVSLVEELDLPFDYAWEPVGHLFGVARIVASQLGLANGYRLVINCKSDGGQEVPHLHVHLLGGRKLSWPPG